MTEPHSAFSPADFFRRRFGLIVLALFLLQGVLWVGLPLLFEGSIRVDVAEGVIDGPEWQLSYLRHPPLSTWLSGLAWQAGPLRYAAVYAIGWLLASGAFAQIAFFLRRADRPEAGLTAFVFGLVSPFATYVPIQVNHNITLMFFWAATLAAGFTAFEAGSLAAWLLFGAVVGLSFWAKYSIIHLLLPLGVAMLAHPVWRRRALTPGPWLAVALAGLIAAPHFLDVIAKKATTIAFASMTLPATPLVKLGWAGEFLGDCLLANFFFVLLAALVVGPRALKQAVAAMFRRATATRLDFYLVAVALGPVLFVLLATPWGKQPHYLWMTAFNVSFAAFWARAVSRAALGAEPSLWRRLPRVYAVFAALAAFGYVAIAEVAPRIWHRQRYVDMDAAAFKSLVQSYWAEVHGGEIPYLVTTDGPQIWHSMQAAGSIAFDSPKRIRTLVAADPAHSAWLDADEPLRKGALVLSVVEIHDGDKLLDVAIRNVRRFDRPALHGARPEAIYLGVLPARP